jgi:hypothetical protein
VRVSGLVCTILVDIKFFIPIPVSTLAAWISTSKTSVERSGGANVRVACHFSKVPLWPPLLPRRTQSSFYRRNLVRLTAKRTRAQVISISYMKGPKCAALTNLLAALPISVSADIFSTASIF